MEDTDGGLHPAVDGQSLDEMRWGPGVYPVKLLWKFRWRMHLVDFWFQPPQWLQRPNDMTIRLWTARHYWRFLVPKHLPGPGIPYLRGWLKLIGDLVLFRIEIEYLDLFWGFVLVVVFFFVLFYFIVFALSITPFFFQFPWVTCAK